MTTEFGRRKPAAKTPALAKSPAATATANASGEEPGAAEIFFSYMLGPLGGVIVGFLIVCVIASFYISNMRSMGRSLDQSWSKKTIGPVEDSWGRRPGIQLDVDEPDFARLSNRPCEVRSPNPSFREVQRRLGC